MALTENDIILEVGSEALEELTVKEKAAILAKYSAGEEKVAAMRIFYVLSMKFKPSYKMGSTFEELSSKYKKYWELYCHLAKTLSAGRTTGFNDTTYSNESANNAVKMDRWKWPGQIQ